ncbi:MAG: penicillin-binding protein 2 [Parvularculales bacterium]
MSYDDFYDTEQRQLTRRMMLLGAGQAALFGGLAARMFYLQVVQYDYYSMLAEDNRIKVRLLIPLRGRIVDRSGVSLAVNRQEFRVALVPESVESIPDALDKVRDIITLDEAVYNRVIENAQQAPRFAPITVASNLTWEQFSKLNINVPNLPGLYPEVGYKRHYPWRGSAAHIIGYVGATSPDDISFEGKSSDDGQTVDPLLKLPDFRIGRRGVERGVDRLLRGAAGVSRVEVNAFGRVIREVDRKLGESGRDVALTLDMDTQAYAARLLEGKSGASVVLDTQNGDVISIVSAPSYDPNELSDGITQENWQRLLRDPKKPLLDRTLAGQYPPGSTFKLVVVLAALENNIISPSLKITCQGVYSFGGRQFHCWKKEGHGTLDLVGSITHSCDIYFYELARKVGINAISDMAGRLGLGQKFNIGFDIGLAEQRGGLIPTRDWKKDNFGEIWYAGETLILGIGQGYVLTTPMQLAVMTARLASGNLDLTPRLVWNGERAALGAQDVQTASPKLSDYALNVVREGMIAVSNTPDGTAYGARLRLPGVALAGKTGTSQVRRITESERLTGVLDNEELEWKMRDHALFVGYAPVDKPRYAISVVVEHGGSGSRVAAPIARDLMTHVLKRDLTSLGPYSQDV